MTFLTVLVRWLVGWTLLWRVPVVPVAPGAPPAPATRPSRDGGAPEERTRISVVVPARDEEHRLPALLAGLARQRLPADELFVVDDHSTDATASIARAGGARVLASAPLPGGWTGKSWACWQGSRVATGDVLVFLDADTEPEADLLERLVAEQGRRGGIVSVQPYHRMERAYERLSAFFNLVAWMGIGAGSARRRAPVTGAFGPCLAVDRAAYFDLGGHAGVRSDVLEDVALARVAQAAGLPVSCYGGRGVVAFRMYPSGPAQLVEGWSKNFSAGAGSTPSTRLVLIVAWLSAVLTTGWQATAGLLAAVGDGAGPAGVVWAWYGAFALQLAWMLRRLGNFGLTALLFPLAALGFVAIFVRSVWWSLRGQVQWKGRTIPVRGVRA